MKDRGLIFQAESVKAILAGTKTMTRRLVKWPKGVDPTTDVIELHRMQDGYPDGVRPVFITHDEPFSVKVMQVGQRVYAKEVWAVPGAVARSDDPVREGMRVVYRADTDESYSWRSPLFMPKWAARLWLEITAVKVERLQAITDQECIAEGVRPAFVSEPVQITRIGCRDVSRDGIWSHTGRHYTAIERLAEAWDGINGKTASWASNPFVVAYTFKRVEK